MKVYIYNEQFDEFEGFYFSFKEEQLIDRLKEEFSYLENDELEDVISKIEETEINFPDCSWIITDYDEWSAEYSLEKFIKTTEELQNINFLEYINPELHRIDCEGNIDNQPFIFIQ